LNGKIYVVGGWPNERTVEVYDPATGGWSIAAPLRIGRQSPGLAGAPDGYLYVSGGGNEWAALASAERYDPATDTWEAIAALNVRDRAGTASVYAAGKVFTVGGAWLELTAANESLNLFDDFCRSSKFAWQDTVQPGGRITYTVTIRADAAGPISASLVDPIPAGTTFAGFGPNLAGARYDSARNQVTWSGTTPARYGRLTFTFGVNVNRLGPACRSPVTNVVTFATGSGRVFTRTQVSTVEFPDPCPSAKRVNQGEVVAGDALTYTILVGNRSTISGTFSLRDPIPAGTSYVPGSLTSSLGVGGYSPAQQAITWTGRLPLSYTYANTGDDYEWGDSLGQGTVPGVGFDWVEISDTGTLIGFDGPAEGGHYYPIVLPFPFPFYGTPHTSLAVATNGPVYFEDAYLGWTNGPIPQDTGRGVNTFIAPLWDGLDVRTGGVYYEVQGSAPNRRVVVEYHRVSSCCGPSPDDGTWEVILYENGAILMQYLDVTFGDARDYGASATVGIQNSPTQGLQYSYDTPALSGGLAILFLPPGASWTGESRHANVAFTVRTGPTWPVNAWLTNTAIITGPYGPVQRGVGTRITPLDLHGSVKTADKAEVALGEAVRYTLLLKNDSLLTATGVTLTDPIPPGLAYVPGSLTYTLGTARYSTATNAITWTGALPALSQHSAEVSFAVTLATLLCDSTPVTNVAHLNDGHGKLYELETAFVGRGLGPTPSFKQADPLRVLPGGIITYTIYLRNTGSSPAPGHMQDALPPGLTYEAGSLLCYSGSCTYDAGKVTWTGMIPPGSMVPVRFRARVPANAAPGDRITNTAIVTDTANGFACSVLATVTVVGYPEENDRFLPLVMRH